MIVSVFRSNKDMINSNNQLLASLLFVYLQNCGWNLTTKMVCVMYRDKCGVCWKSIFSTMWSTFQKR